MWSETNEIAARKSTGQQVTLKVITQFADTGDRADPHDRQAVGVTIVTTSGTRLNPIEKGRYVDPLTREEFVSDDPSAP